MRVTIDPVVIDKRPRSLVHMFLERVDEHARRGRLLLPGRGRLAGVDLGADPRARRGPRRRARWRSASSPRTGSRSSPRPATSGCSRYLATLWSGAAVDAVDPAGRRRDEVARVLQRLRRPRRDGRGRRRRARAVADPGRRSGDVTKVVQVDGDYPDERVLSLEGLLALGHRPPRAAAAGARAAAVRRTPAGAGALHTSTTPRRPARRTAHARGADLPGRRGGVAGGRRRVRPAATSRCRCATCSARPCS